MEIENEERYLIRCNRYAEIRNTLFVATTDVESDLF